MFEVEKVEGEGWSVETDECAMCNRCKEWSGAIAYLTEDFEVDEYVSNCCTAGLSYFHPSSRFEDLVIEAAKITAEKE